MASEVVFEILYSDTINFAMQQNHVQPIHRLRIRNTSGHDLRGLTLTVDADPAFAMPFRIDIPLLKNREKRNIDAVLPPVPSLLFSLTESVRGALNITLTQGERVVERESREITVLAYDEWQGLDIMPEVTAAFVTPNHPYVTELVKRATPALRRLSRGAVFDGYAGGSPHNVQRQVEAIYNTLASEGLTYQLPPASFGAGQRLRLADTVSEGHCGTCIDLTLLLAGCLEAVRLNPLLIFTESHAFLGVWLVSDTYAECVQEDISALTKRSADGISELLLVESTALTRGIPFEEACVLGEGHLADAAHFRYALDVHRARLSGINPISLRRYDRKGNLLSPDEGAERRTGRGNRGQVPIDPADTVFYTKQQLWERKLLDLSLRNSLLNFRSSRRSVQFLCRDCAGIASALFAGGDFTPVARPNELDGELTRTGGLYPAPAHLPDKLLRAEQEQKRLRTYLDEKELAEALTSLYRSARTSTEESGANPLYLALGFLRWYESDRSAKEYYAPLVLLPVELVRRAVPRGYVMRLRDEDPRFNITLLELLRNNFDIRIPGLDPLPKTEDGIDLRRVFSILRRALMQQNRWDVLECVCLANFGFSRFIMWNDLHNRAQDLEANRVVNALIRGSADWHDAPVFLSPEELDEQVFPADIAAPLPYDSSQLAAIHAAAQGASFVLHGPPGTGKSQTITNMICNALYAGKSVLFIAEKMAALSVVQSRLDKLGLSPFCLELHSDKAKKGDVLRHLSETMDAANAVSPREHTEEAGRLLALRRSLRETVSLIHHTHPCGFSLYQLIARYEQYRDAAESDFFTEEHCRIMTPALWRAWEDLVREYVAMGEGCGGVFDNPLAIYRKPGYTQADKPALLSALQSYLRLADSMEKELQKVRAILPFGKIKSFDQLASVAALCSRLSEITVLPAGILTSNVLLSGQERVARLCEVGRRHVQLREVLLFRFDADLLRLDPAAALRDLRAAQTAPLLLRHGRLKRERARLAVYAKDPSTLAIRDIEGVWRLLREYRDTAETVRDLLPAGKALFGELCREECTDFVYLERLHKDATDIVTRARTTTDNRDELKALLAAIDKAASRGELLRHTDTLRAFCATFEELTHAEEAVAVACGVSVADWHENSDWFGTERQLFRRAAERIDSLRDYCTYRTKRQEMRDAGLGALTDLAESGKVQITELPAVFYRNASLALASHIIENDPKLAGFTGVMMEERIKDYSETCERFSRLTVEELLARLSARVPHAGENADSSESAVLGRAIRSVGRGLSLRRLFDSIPHLLRRLCPCMLMSPLSVAQYLDPALPPFDLVIFDEASQMPTCEAVGAIARGEHLVVVGDPKQLPPTTFFSTLHYDEDNSEREDLDSLLDDCLALSMPQLHLLWHYRSRHESLIAFSNSQYYDGKLYTFPSPSEQVSRVTYVPVEGIYDRGRTKQNRAEAEAVVSEVIRRLRDPVLQKSSIGIVTFSSVQQLLIEDLLEARLARTPDAEAAANALYEPIFVKNLENVQGDERDVILFSVCYGPDRTGHVGVNFGPLNREGGWRRLNVAVSRARQEMMIFTSLAPEQIDLGRTNAEGVAGLRAFLEYARDGQDALTTRRAEENTPYGIADCIAEILRRRGYVCHTHVGSSAGQIDVAVLDSRCEGEYLLGILCDTPSPAGSETMRDRNILRSSVLASLGWQLHRVWSVDFWDAPMREIEKIVKAIDRARRRARKLLPPPVRQMSPRTVGVSLPTGGKNAPVSAPAKAAPLHERTVYRATSLKEVPAAKRNCEAFFAPANFQTVLYQIREVLITESPVSYPLLRRRLTDAWGIRSSAKVDAYLATLLGETRSTARRDGDVTFYWSLGQQPEEYIRWRVPASPKERREATDIPTEELAAAFAAVTEEQLSLSAEDAKKLVARAFGFSKPTAALEPRLNAALALAVKRGAVREQNGQLISPNA